MQTDTIQDCYAVWQKFLSRWPLSALETMTLPQYHTANDPKKDNFANWLEIHTQCLGSIWGMSALKFGIYNRAEQSKEIKGLHIRHNSEYAWRKKYGATPEEAYSVVRTSLLNIAKSAKIGDIKSIANIDFDSMVKWKIAFLYQDKDSPILPCIYAQKWLMKILDIEKHIPTIDMYKAIMQRINNRDILDFSFDLINNIIKQNDEIDIEKEEKINTNINRRNTPINRIFYGPPGTGKTWHTIDAALEIIDPEIQDNLDRKERKEYFDALVKEKRIRFVTFHQSFSYEDFVEGIRPEIIEDGEHRGQLFYSVRPGIFKEMCEAAQARTDRVENASVDLTGKKIWKMSLGNSLGDTAYIYDECLKTGRILMGWGDRLDFGSCSTEAEIRAIFKANSLPEDYAVTAVTNFVLHMKPGDIVVISEGLSKLRAIAEITGNYEVVNREDDGYGQARTVRWLCTFTPSKPVSEVLNRQFSQMTLYRLKLDAEEEKNLGAILTPQSGTYEPGKYVLIIDEINRGNISGIFGELITLIEKSKRIGEDEELRVRLPYSSDQELFGVPNNLYIIGTMNSADRSLAGMDIALRRRFTFEEMRPKPELLADKILEGSNCSLKDILSKMNERIEFLLDRDHCIGHAPFINLGNIVTVDDIAHIFKGSILPLLQEYFFDDWEKIHYILNDHKKPDGCQFIREKKIPQDMHELDNVMSHKLWDICDDDTYYKMELYIGIVSKEDVDTFIQYKEIKAVPLNIVPEFALPIQGDFMRACQYGKYTLVQYRENGSKAIKIYELEKPIETTLVSVLRRMNENLNLGIARDEERDARHFADILLDKLEIPLRP